MVWSHALTRPASVRIIARSGDVVLDNYAVGTGPSAGGYCPFRGSIYLDGTWTVQAVVDGSPAAETVFRTVNGISSPAKLELAAITEAGGSGTMTFRIANYSRVGIVSSRAYLNTDHATPIQSFRPVANSNNSVDLWVESNLPRYRAGSACGQPGSSADLTRQLSFYVDTAGNVGRNALDVSESGTLIAYSARGNVQMDAAGTTNVHVAARLNGVLLFRQADGTWSTSQMPLFSFVGHASRGAVPGSRDPSSACTRVRAAGSLVTPRATPRLALSRRVQ